MSETPVILAHNVFKNALITGDCREGYPPSRIADGLRWTWWEGVSAATQYIDAVVPNMLRNGDFEFNAHGWFVLAMGGASGSFSWNSANPLDGAGDGFMDVEDADNAGKTLYVASTDSFRLKAGRSYRFSFVAKSDGDSRMFRFGFVNGQLNGEACYEDASLTNETTELFKDFTPEVDGDFRVFWRPLEAGEYSVDSAHLCEAPEADALVFDAGHTLQLYFFSVEKSDTAYSNAASSIWCSDRIVAMNGAYYYQNPSPGRGVKWRVKIQPIPSIPGLPTPQISSMWIGKQWSLPRNFSGSFDPDARKCASHVIVGERGVETRTRQYSQRTFSGALKNVTPAEYVEIDRFMDDADCGANPFVFIPKPSSDPGGLTVMRLEKEERFAPYRGGYLRDWNFSAVEIAGARRL